MEGYKMKDSVSGRLNEVKNIVEGNLFQQLLDIEGMIKAFFEKIKNDEITMEEIKIIITSEQPMSIYQKMEKLSIRVNENEK